MHDVRVALYGHPEEGYPWSSALDDPSTTPPYLERLAVVVKAAESEPLGHIIDRAGSYFGISVPEPGSGVQEPQTLSQLLTYTAFYRRGEDTGLPSYLRTLTIVSPDGQARFSVPWAEVLYGDLLRTNELGLLDGEIASPYIFLPTAFGDFAGFDWPDVISALEVGWRVIEHAATVLGLASGLHWSKGLLDSLRRRSAPRVRLLQQYASSWRERGAAPADLDRLLSLRAWRADQIGALLGCPLEHAEAILWALGASYNHADGCWYMERTSEDKVLHGELAIAIWGREIYEDGGESWRTSEDRLMKYLKTGQAPRLPWEK